MLNVFQLADNDQSIFYLGQVFGNVGASLSGTGPALLSQLFKVFNTIILAIAVIIVIYVTVIGVMKTAAEGEILGKGWSTLWVPIRTVFGVAILMPTTTGYCAAQILIMWFIVQGVGAADMVWSAAINYFGQGGGIMSAPNPSPQDIGDGATTIWTNIMQNLICQSVVTKFSQDNEDAVAQTQQTTDENGQIIFNFGNAAQESTASECGQLTLPIDGAPVYQVTYNNETASGAQNTYVSVGGIQVYVPSPSYQTGVTVVQSSFGTTGRQQGLYQAYQTAFPTLQVIADYYVKQVIDDLNCWNTPCTPSPTQVCTYFNKWSGFLPDNSSCFYGPTTGNNAGWIAWSAVLTMAGSNFLLDVTKIFTGEASNYATNAAVGSSQPETGTTMSDISPNLQKAQANGWVYAGAYYYSLAGTSNQVQDSYTNFINASLITPYTFSGPDFDGSNPQNPDADPRTAIVTYSKFLTNQAMQSLSTTTTTGGGLLVSSGGDTSNKLRSSSKGVMRMWMNLIAPAEGNPLARIQSFGHNVLLAADILCIAFFGASLILAGAGTHFVFAGTTVSAWYQVALQGLSVLTTAFFFVVAYLVTVGGLMGVYVPLIPYVIFSLGVIGWMIVVVEAMVAAPIIALGILSPSGQSELFSQGAASIMLTLNLMLRPALMVIGMFGAMLLAGVVVKFINSAFYSIVAAFTATPGMFETFLFIIAYVGLIIIALNKCFELIAHVPDRSLHWIGHQVGAGAGEAQAAAELKGKVGAGAEVGAGGAKGVGGRVASQAAETGKMHEAGTESKEQRQEAEGKKEEGYAAKKKGLIK